MVRVVDCRAGVLGSTPGGPRIFSPWNYFTGGSGNSVALSFPLGITSDPINTVYTGSEVKYVYCNIQNRFLKHTKA